MRREKNNSVAEAHRFSDIMCNKYYCLFCFSPDFLQFHVQHIPCLRIKRRTRFIHQQNLELYRKLLADPEFVKHSLREGALKARAIAQDTVAGAKKLMGLVPDF